MLERIYWGQVHTFLEPCRGDGAIANLIPPHVEQHWAEIEDGRDYLEHAWRDLDLIITNPPFSLALEFLTKSLREARTVCYLLRLNFLGSGCRQSWWNSNRPTHVLPLAQRPRFALNKHGKLGSDATEYAWFCWDRGGLVLAPWLEVM
jgi:hypothetical protein